MPEVNFHKEDLRDCSALVKKAKERAFFAVKFLPKDTRDTVLVLRAFVQIALTLKDAADNEGLVTFKEAWRSALISAPPINIPAVWFSVLRATSEVFRVYKIDAAEGSLFFAALEKDLARGLFVPQGDIDEIEKGMAAVGRMFAKAVQCDDERGVIACGEIARAMYRTESLVRYESGVIKHRRVAMSIEVCRAVGVEDHHLTAGKVSPELVALFKKHIAETRQIYRSSERALALLPIGSSRAARVIAAIYESKLDRIVAQKYDVFHGARKPSLVMRLLVSLRLWIRLRG